jgi:hypothetical protein
MYRRAASAVEADVDRRRAEPELPHAEPDRQPGPTVAAGDPLDRSCRVQPSTACPARPAHEDGRPESMPGPAA